MATRRRRGNGWEFTVRRAKLLDKPLYLTFETEAEGKTYCEQLERLLDQGIVPEAVRERTKTKEARQTLTIVLRDYLSKTAVSDADSPILDRQILDMGSLDIRSMNHDWADGWITSLKREKKLAPSTIRHHVGALARGLDFATRQGHIAINPLRNLRKGYATYTDEDAIAAGERRVEKTREKRLSKKLESAVIDYLPDLRQGDDLLSLFTVGLETGMRLSEMFTLRKDSVHLKRQLARLIKTKNGTTRDVPLSSKAIAALEDQMTRAGEFMWPWYAEKLTELELERPKDKRNELDAKKKTTNMLSTRWIRIFTACGDDEYTIHYLRHEAASRVMENTNMPADQIMKMFGWKSWEMVDRYSHLRASTMAGYLN